MKKKEKLNILVLHWLRDPREARDVLLKLVFFLKKYHPEHNYLYHDVSLPLPEYIKNINFDAIILDVTLLCLRYPYYKKYFDLFNKHFSFIKNLDTIKIAFPQDDYDCSEILDNWMVDWNVNVVFSPLANNPDINVIYPKYSKVGIIELGYTGYIDNDHFKMSKYARNFEKRDIDIFYRARKLPPYFGRIGELKWRIADLIKIKAQANNLKLDISYEEKDTILGERWYEYLGNSKFTLGSLSGSSLVDPKGEIQEKVKEYCKKRTNYDYEEIEKLFFPGLDKYNFTALSPRNIEAAFTFTGQILVRGPYSNVLKPWEDYIPLEPDASNFYEVYEAMNDIEFVKKMIKNCYEKLVERKDLYYSDLANKIINFIYSQKENNQLFLYDRINMELLLKKYDLEYSKKYKRLFFSIRLRKKIINIIKKIPFLYNLLKYVRDRIQLLN